MPGRDTPDRVERGDVAFEERLLALGRVDAVDRLARVRHPEHEHVALGLDPSQDHPHLTEVDLRLHARGVLLRDEHLDPPPSLHLDDSPTQPHPVPHRRVRQPDRTVFLHQSGMDPPGGVPLLPRRRQIRLQHLVDGRLVRVQPGRRPHGCLPRWGPRVHQGGADRSTVHPMPSRELTDRQPLDPLVPANSSEQLHP